MSVLVRAVTYAALSLYIGAGLALAGAALFYETRVLWAYAGGFLLLLHLFVVLYEEPTLRATFGDDYGSYCRHVRRWWPGPGRSSEEA